MIAFIRFAFAMNRFIAFVCNEQLYIYCFRFAHPAGAKPELKDQAKGSKARDDSESHRKVVGMESESQREVNGKSRVSVQVIGQLSESHRKVIRTSSVSHRNVIGMSSECLSKVMGKSN